MLIVLETIALATTGGARLCCAGMYFLHDRVRIAWNSGQLSALSHQPSAVSSQLSALSHRLSVVGGMGAPFGFVRAEWAT
jgi:hypothetical protein